MYQRLNTRVLNPKVNIRIYACLDRHIAEGDLHIAQHLFYVPKMSLQSALFMTLSGLNSILISTAFCRYPKTFSLDRKRCTVAQHAATTLNIRHGIKYIRQFIQKQMQLEKKNNI